MAMNCERSIRYIAEIEKKLTIRYNALVIGLRRDIIIIADPTARIANNKMIIFSVVHFKLLIRLFVARVPTCLDTGIAESDFCAQSPTRVGHRVFPDPALAGRVSL